VDVTGVESSDRGIKKKKNPSEEGEKHHQECKHVLGMGEERKPCANSVPGQKKRFGKWGGKIRGYEVL